MPDQLQLRGGTTTEHNSFTGALREVTVDTTKKTLVVHDGASAGGTPLMRENGGNAASSVQLGSGGVNAFTIDSNQDITLTGASANVVWDKSQNQLEFADSAFAAFGDGNDLQIHHNGTRSEIINNTGDLIIQASANNKLMLRAQTGESHLIGYHNAQVELYFDNARKLKTNSTGFQVGTTSAPLLIESLTSGDGSQDIARVGLNRDNGSTSDRQLWSQVTVAPTVSKFNIFARSANDTGTAGNYLEIDAANNNFDIPRDNLKLRIGASADLQIFHGSNHSFITNITNELRIGSNFIKLKNDAYTESYIEAEQNGAVELYFDNSKKFETTSSGVSFANGADATTSKLTLALGNASQKESSIQGYSTTTNEKGIVFKTYNFASKTPLTLTPGGHLNIPDNSFLRFGDSQDLSIYHDGGNSIIRESGTGSLFIESSTNIFLGKESGAETYIKGIPDGAVELYFDNSKKLETSAAGVAMTGDVSISGEVNLTTGGNKHRFIDSSLGNGEALFLRSTTNGDANHEDMAIFVRNGNCQLFFDNVQKLATTTNGVTVIGSVLETSDIALKSDIKPLTNTLEKIQQITGYKYNFINSISPSMGVLAQDVEKVFPELVHGSEGKKTLQYSGLIGVLVEAVKDLSAKVAALEAA